MSRWPGGARTRLEDAAMELFVQHGFADTTVPQIAARAGLTTRTFFRHFSDKREVLFAYQAELPELVRRVMADTPASSSPIEVIVEGLGTIAATRFEGKLDYLRVHRAVVDADEGLRERELRKMVILSEAISRGFRDRGVDDLTAALAAHTAVSVLTVALTRWLAQDVDGKKSLAEHISDTFSALETLHGPRA